jgi:hypothetical protein
LAEIGLGISKMSGFNDFASKEIERYIEANKHALKEFCNNQQSAMASAC